MNERERQELINKEIEALYEELDNTINQLVILRPFFKNLLNVINGTEPAYEFSKIPREQPQKDYPRLK